MLNHIISASLMFEYQVKTWDKVNSGMQKMYLAEVLGKLPVMQHFLFGSILVYDGPVPPNSDNDHDDAHRGHAHAHTADLGGAGQQSTGFGDCCGIPIPSAFGAAQAEKGRPLAGIRPVPFD
jgi:serine/threonine-protein phosphatase 2A activator